MLLRATAFQLLVLARLVQSQAAPQNRVSILATGALLETLYAQGANTEGPAVARDGTIFFVDSPTSDARDPGRILRFDPRTRETTLYRSPSGQALGLKFDPGGRLVVAEYGARRITRTELATGRSEVLASSYEGRGFNAPNDLVVDSRGRVYFTDFGKPAEGFPQGFNGVYRVDSAGTIDRIVLDGGRPNGITLSPDEKTLYVGATRFDALGRRAVLAFDLSADGKATFRSIFADFGMTRYPDGMTVDSEGNLYVAVPAGSQTGVAVFNRGGDEVAFIETPGPATNVVFGLGADDSSLYITGGKSLWRIHLNRRGHSVQP
jgi:gluconolactonase